MLVFFGLIDLLVALILLFITAEVSFPLVVSLVALVVLFFKSLLNPFSFAGLIDILASLILLSWIAGVDLSSYRFLIAGLAILLTGKAFSSFSN